MFNKISFRQSCRQTMLIVPALAVLLYSQSASSQQQIKKSFAVHTPTTLSAVDFEDGTITDNVDDSAKNFVDIGFGSGPDIFLAASGTELFEYPGVMVPSVLVHDFKDDSMRSILAFAVDPNTERIYVFAEAKGKPTHKLLIGESGASWVFGGVVQEDFPKFVDVVASIADSPLGEGVVAADEKNIYFLATSTGYASEKKAGKKFIGLNGPEDITGVTVLPDTMTALVATDRRRLLLVDLTGVLQTQAFLGVLSSLPCASDRNQNIGVASTRDQGTSVVVVSDYACNEVRAFDDAGAPLSAPLLTNNPENPVSTEGEPLDLNACASPSGCEWSTPGVATVTLQSFSGDPDGVLQQVTGATDCRCNHPVNGVLCPGQKELNIFDILPDNVKNLGIVDEESLVPVYLKGDPVRNCEIGLFLTRTGEDTVTGIAEGLWEIDELLSEQLGVTRCETGIPRSDNPDYDRIHAWDVVGHIPTRGVTVCPECSTAPIGHGTLLASDSCGSSGWAARGFSAFVYGLSVNCEDPASPTAGDDPTCMLTVVNQLITDLGVAINVLADPPLSDGDHTKLTSRFDNILDKWTKAQDAMINQPNAADTTLSAVVSQILNLKDENRNEVTYGADPNSTQDEIEVRCDGAVFAINERLRASVPLIGFPTP